MLSMYWQYYSISPIYRLFILAEHPFHHSEERHILRFDVMSQVGHSLISWAKLNFFLHPSPANYTVARVVVHNVVTDSDGNPQHELLDNRTINFTINKRGQIKGKWIIFKMRKQVSNWITSHEGHGLVKVTVVDAAGNELMVRADNDPRHTNSEKVSSLHN